MPTRYLAFLFATIVLSSPIVHAGERLRVVVNDLDANGVTAQAARVVSEHLRVKLIETRRFIIPEREKMVAILAEQSVGASLTDCFSQECAIEIGRLLQANKMVVGTASLLNQTYSISIRFLDLETGAAEFSAEEKCTNADDLFLAAERLAARVVAFIPPRGRVTAVSGGHIIIDLGLQDGVSVGMNFRVLRKVERVPGYPEEEQIAAAQATAVQATWSRIEAPRTRETIMRPVTIQEGDVVIGPQTVAVSEIPRYAYLMIFSQPVGAEVYVDNLFQGRTKEGGLEVRTGAGRHTIRVSANAYKSDERVVELQANQRMPYNATLEAQFRRPPFNMQITAVSYVRQSPRNAAFKRTLDGEALQGAQLGLGRVYRYFATEIGGTWTHANMAPGEGYGLNEVHRLTLYGHAGLALPLGFVIPYGGIGYEVGRLMFNEDNVMSGQESLGKAGKIGHDGWYWTAGLFMSKWLRVEYRNTWGRTQTDISTLTVGLNISGF